MNSKRLSHPERGFVAEVRLLEEKLFSTLLDESDPIRMKNDGQYSWLYRPSHHVKTGLITQSDIAFLSQQGKRLLSIGAHPAFLEQVICALGVPITNVVIADADPGILRCGGSMEKVMFDATGTWPHLGTFDLIIFPESLCICVGDHIKSQIAHPRRSAEDPFPTDKLEVELLSALLGQALACLRPGGEIRANGPMSHPSVVKKSGAVLDGKGLHHYMEYLRYFLRVRAAVGESAVEMY